MMYCFVILSQIVLTCFSVMLPRCVAMSKDTGINAKKWFSYYERTEVAVEADGNVDGSSWLKMTFTCFNHTFVLFLSESSPFDDSMSIFLGTEPYIIQNLTKKVGLFEGQVVSPDSGEATIRVADGIDGTVRWREDTLYMEPVDSQTTVGTFDMHHDVPYQLNRKHLYDCFVYRLSDYVNRNEFDNMGKNESSFCGTTHNIFQHIYPTNQDTSTIHTARYKRNTITKTECSLHVVADHLFFDDVGRTNVLTTISIIGFYVKEANKIFRQTDFSGDGESDNTGVFISQVTVYDATSENYKLTGTMYSEQEYLLLFSEYNFADDCLGILFTNRDFQGILGLAWVGSSNPHSTGGICQQPLFLDRKLYSLNTAWVSAVNFGHQIPAFRVALTLAHEIGHSFGSPHDEASNAVCVPEGPDGYFVMAPYANDGSKPNHFIFSSCSISSIFPVIVNKGSCFKGSQDPICGNRIIESGEECDCGTISTCQFTDICCVPSNSFAEDDVPCSLRRSQGRVCSPQNGPCCTSNCTFIPSAENKVCNPGTGCQDVVFCDGTSSACGFPVLKPDGHLCDGDTRTCVGGLCRGSVCQAASLSSCLCTDDEHLCHQCCRDPSGSCLPTHLINIAPLSRSPKIRVGEPCSNYKGYCDAQGSCILKDPESLFQSLQSALMKKGIDAVKVWFMDYWYYVVIGAGAFLFLALVFCLTVRKKEDVHTSAYMHAQIIRVRREAEAHINELEARKARYATRMENDIELHQAGAQERNFVEAFARLRVFFPTVSNEVLTKTLRTSTSEDDAVRWLLVRGYGFRRVLNASVSDANTSEQVKNDE